MPKLQTLTRTARGLYTNWNAVNGIPEGGLLEARNVNIDQMGTISKMRGRSRFGNPAGTTKIDQVFEYSKQLCYITSAAAYWHDTYGTGNWIAFTGVFPGPNKWGTFFPIAEIDTNLYIIGLNTFVRTQHLIDDFERAGIRPGTDLELTKTGTGAGMFAVDSQVAYRYVFVKKGWPQKKDYIGAPSRREVAANPKTTGLAFANSGGVITVTHNAHGFASGDVIEVSDTSDALQVTNGPKTLTGVTTNTYTFAATGAGTGGTLSDGKKFNHTVYLGIPPGVASGDYVRVYRTSFSASATTDPGDEMKLIKEHSVGSTAVTNGYLELTDDVEEAFLGDYLYTNATQEGIAMANEEPPIARDLAYWKGHAWLAYTKSLHYFEVALDSIQGLTDGTSSITISESDTPWSYNLVFDTAENFSTGHFKRFTSEPTQAQNVEKTAKSLCKVINRYASAYVMARYVSEANDRPGKIIIEDQVHVTKAFSVVANNSTCGGKWTPNLSSSVGSTQDVLQNQLAHSKFEQPDAFPEACTDFIGGTNRAILRILPLRDSLIIVTEQGIFRVSGESDGLGGFEFVITTLDPSIQGVCPRSWVVLNNAVYGLSTQGVVRIDETGTDLVSQQIEEDLKIIFGVSGYAYYTHAVAYESDRKYILYYEDSYLQYANKAFVYNYLTNTWTKREKNVTAAHVLSADDKLYEGQYFDPATNHYILQERKTFATDLTDFQDEDATGTLTSHSTTTFEGATVSTVVTSLDSYFEAVGSLFVQGALKAHIVEVNAGVCTLDALLVGLTDTAACTIYKGIPSRVRWRPEACQNPGIMKQFPRTSLYFEAINALRHKVSFFSDEQRTEEALQDLVQSATLDNPVLAVNVPRKFQRCRALDLVYEHNRARETFDILNVAYTFRGYGDLVSRSPR